MTIMTPQELETLLKENFRLRVEINEDYREYSDSSGSYKDIKVTVILENSDGEAILKDYDSFTVDSP